MASRRGWVDLVRAYRRGLAGHSHFHNTRHRKAAVDACKQTTFQKLSREIYAAISVGGEDVASNARLRRALENAKRSCMPKKRIDNALEKGRAGQGDDTVVFEGVFGEVGVLIRTYAHRRNAIAGEMRAILSRGGAELGKAGWMFEEWMGVVVSSGRGGDDLMLYAMEVGVEDVQVDADGDVRLMCSSRREMEHVREAVVRRFDDLRVDVYCVREVKPKRTVVIKDQEQARRFERMVEVLQGHDEVVDVIHNAA